MNLPNTVNLDLDEYNRLRDFYNALHEQAVEGNMFILKYTGIWLVPFNPDEAMALAEKQICELKAELEACKLLKEQAIDSMMKHQPKRKGFFSRLFNL